VSKIGGFVEEGIYVSASLEGNKKNFQFYDFCTQVSALLVDSLLKLSDSGLRLRQDEYIF